FFFQAEDGIRDFHVTGVQTCALPIFNPAAMDDPASPIAGMPVIRVWEAEEVVVFKRSMASGYAGVQNPLFFRDNSSMLFGDARQDRKSVVEGMSKKADGCRRRRITNM